MRWVSRLQKTDFTRLNLLLVGAHLASVNLVSDLFEAPLGLGLLILQFGQLNICMIRKLATVPLLLAYVRPVQRTGRFGQLLKELLSVAPMRRAFRLQFAPRYGD